MKDRRRARARAPRDADDLASSCGLPSIRRDDRGGSMRQKRSRVKAAAVVALAAMAAACSSGSGSGSGGGGSFSGTPLTAAGSTFVQPVYQKWFHDFQGVESG